MRRLCLSRKILDIGTVELALEVPYVVLRLRSSYLSMKFRKAVLYPAVN